MPSRIFTGVLLALLGLGTMLPLIPVQAQPAGEKPFVLDWDTAWKMAQDKNESFEIAKNGVEIARRKVAEAYSSAMPTVDMNGTYNHYFQIPSSIFYLPASMSPTGQKLRVKTQFGSENNINYSVQLTQPVWLAGKVGLALKVAKDYKKISELSVKVSRDDLYVMLTKSFYGAKIAEEYLAVARDALKQTEKHEAQVKEMYNQGVVSEYDLIRAKVAVSNTKPQVIEAEATRDLALKGLKNLIGLDVDRDITVAGDLDSVLAAPEMDYESASSMALKKRVELQQLQLQKNLYEYQYKIEKRSTLWPNFLVGLNWQSSAQSPDTRFGKYEFLNGWGGQVILQIPLFDGFAGHQRAQTALVNKRNVELQRNMLKRGIKVQVFQALRDYQKSVEEYQAAQENLTQAQRGYDIAETRYASGVGTQLESLDAQLQLNSSKVNLLQAKYNQLVAKAEYDRAVGNGFPSNE